jgi:hypothetical protein
MNESLKNNTDLISEYINKLIETLDMRRDLSCFDNILFKHYDPNYFKSSYTCSQHQKCTSKLDILPKSIEKSLCDGWDYDDDCIYNNLDPIDHHIKHCKFIPTFSYDLYLEIIKKFNNNRETIRHIWLSAYRSVFEFESEPEYEHLKEKLNNLIKIDDNNDILINMLDIKYASEYKNICDYFHDLELIEIEKQKQNYIKEKELENIQRIKKIENILTEELLDNEDNKMYLIDNKFINKLANLIILRI